MTSVDYILKEERGIEPWALEIVNINGGCPASYLESFLFRHEVASGQRRWLESPIPGVRAGDGVASSHFMGAWRWSLSKCPPSARHKKPTLSEDAGRSTSSHCQMAGIGDAGDIVWG